MQYCSLQHWTLLLSQFTSTTGHCICFGFVSFSFWSYFSTLLQQHHGHLLTWGVHLSVSQLFAFSYCSWGSQGKNTKVVCHSLPQWTTLCQTLFQQHKRRLYTWTKPDGQHRNQIDYILCSQRWRSSIQSTKTRPGADCGSDHELLIVKFRLKLKKQGKPLDHSGVMT